MPRDPIPFTTGDVSALAKSLRAQWTARATQSQVPSHVEMLNMLARAAGHRNFQQFRARGDHRPPEDRPEPAEADPAAVMRAARHFDPQGRLQRWPAQRSIQDLCLWGLWARIPAGRAFDERQISDVLTALHRFGDPAILRRTLCHIGLMTRSLDGRDYRRIERAPSPEGAALIRHLRRTGH
ncbi:DUF2087 domain-containing protein [Methylobacterium terricola]|uniref:DUF2087 domain-containing protein n=1 Tax=Methylobacterium terricola TaxID=2583531 RepID=A0A5C4LKS3_9HYPH|nr:DUF2087 domain-containing protein [Methylobacterium terricola]TNC14352.1 DUF2087 domain-containing protein [Methylobacterium terricola]